MPLLKKKHFEKAPIPENLQDNDEIFYCESTGEIFGSYEEFSERMFLSNSMVWTCSMTGKSNLTYAEAKDSEENAKKSILEFPQEVKLPLLYVASKTRRRFFGEMVEDVSSYLRDRYFVSEIVEVCVNGSKWKDSRVVHVIAPSADSQLKGMEQKDNGSLEKPLNPDIKLYKYEVSQPSSDKKLTKDLMIVDATKLRRKRTVLSREKVRLMLRQHVEQNSDGVFVIKKSTIDKYAIDKLNFDNIFDGPPPKFEHSKERKTKQETLLKFLSTSKTDKSNNLKKNGEVDEKNNNNLLEKLRQREAEYKLQKIEKDKERSALRAQKKKDAAKFERYVKDWYKPKEDLELEDHKKLPAPTPVKLQIPDEFVGDTFMVMEFVSSFSQILSAKEYFHGGLTIDLFERALLSKEVAGPFIDMVQMLLAAIFRLQDEEAQLYRIEVDKDNGSRMDFHDNSGSSEAVKRATLASTWSTKYHGVALRHLPLYPLTTSEILRLHLLSSGAKINETGTKWRYAQRGYYTTADDPGLYFCIQESKIIKSLSLRNVTQLPIDDKLKILSCLINQILTYSKVKEKLESNRLAGIDLKNALAAQKRLDQELKVERRKLKKEIKEGGEVLDKKLAILEQEYETKRFEMRTTVEKLIKSAYGNQQSLGLDRAFQRYVKFESLPGLFVCAGDSDPGCCLSDVVKQIPNLANADRDSVTKYLKNKLDEINLSDKENEPSTKSGKTQEFDSGDFNYSELYLCTANPDNCVVHSKTSKKPEWRFFYEEERINELLDGLNKRGTRESELLEVLELEKEHILNLVSQTPVKLLNSDISEDRLNPKQIKKSLPNTRIEYDNFGYPSEMSDDDVLETAIVENILEFEEKIRTGNIGRLLVENRERWRKCLTDRNYKALDKKINRREYLTAKKANGENSGKNRSRSASPEILPNGTNELMVNQDPAVFLKQKLGVTKADEDNNEISVKANKNLLEKIQTLAVALLQIAHAVEPKYLFRPFGNETNSSRHKKKRESESNILNRWEQSLLASTSFSQLFLHYATLDSCVMWSRSVHQAKCRLCRKRKDDVLLACDSCNLTYHMRCLTPKLTVAPEGSWLCKKCHDEIEKEKTPPPPPKKVPIFRDEDIDESEEDESEDSEKSSEDSESESDEDSDSSKSDKDEDVCKVCKSVGELLHCSKCEDFYHFECVDPPLRQPPRGAWVCFSCKCHREKRDREPDSDGKCRMALAKNNSDFSDSEVDEVISKRTTRREEIRTDLPLHNSALHELLSEVMKDNDAWPFLRPVPKTEVPDYYDVITKPMDLGTIKYKLNMGNYKQDSDLMADAVLVFQNCNTYNHTEDDVYQCGVRLLKHFQKKARELGLTLPSEMDYYENGERPRKRNRTKR